MISEGIDVSKEKSTVCILKPYGEIVSKPFEVNHVEKELSELSAMLIRLNDDVRVVMEATGIYYLPVLNYLQKKGLFVAVANPFEMKEYRCQGLRRVKTDKQGFCYHFQLWELTIGTGLKTIKQTQGFTRIKAVGTSVPALYEMRVESVLELTHLLDYTP